MPSTRDFRPTRRGFLQGGAAGAALTGLAARARAQDAAEPVPLDQYEPQFFTAAEYAFVLAATARLIPSEGDGPGAIETRVPVYIDLQLGGDFGQAADWYMEGPFQPDADPLLGYQSPLTPAEVYRQAIPVVEEFCQNRMGAGFADLSPEDQDSVIKALEQNKDPLSGSDSGAEDTEVVESGAGGGASGGSAEPATSQPILSAELRDFFSLLLQNTKEGFFADPMYGGNYQMQGWTYIGFTGARASFKEWVDKHDVPYPLGPVSISGERA
ncbi:gluconate 2-dehydrogenase subunit 3 family protein [Pseudoroseicyclus aestuarii]|uniref:gluconate 2-dehydrogenase subunit 3 family protein n=1 Tax=Pseudoroseicyclus aestuarii TaxID=1795041 RepID=UPI0015E8908B|nr:gluconate 2-dehydrogenase subunit 3 family protein [Pseudoroseicyclus aestuarii]